MPESSSNQTRSGENTKDAEGTQHPFSPRCGWYYIIKIRNSSLREKTYPNPARRVSGHAPVRARPQHRSPAPALGPAAPASALGSRLRVRAHVGGQALQALGWARPVLEGSALLFVFDGLSNSGAWLLPKFFSDWGNGGWRGSGSGSGC